MVKPWCVMRLGCRNFERLHSRKYDADAFLCAFDLLEMDGVDLRSTTLEERKANLQSLAGRVQFVEHLEGDGQLIFEHACNMNLEGIVSKRRDLPYRSVPTKSWLKIKNPASEAMQRLVTQ